MKKSAIIINFNQMCVCTENNVYYFKNINFKYIPTEEYQTLIITLKDESIIRLFFDTDNRDKFKIIYDDEFHSAYANFYLERLLIRYKNRKGVNNNEKIKS